MANLVWFETLTLPVSDLLYVEAVGNYMKVYYLHEGQVRSNMAQIKAAIKA